MHHSCTSPCPTGPPRKGVLGTDGLGPLSAHTSNGMRALAWVACCGLLGAAAPQRRCECSGASVAAAYGSRCGTWDSADEEPWCVVATKDACGSERTFTSEVGHFWAHEP